jgi:hypothetical protein
MAEWSMAVGLKNGSADLATRLRAPGRPFSYPVGSLNTTAFCATRACCNALLCRGDAAAYQGESSHRYPRFHSQIVTKDGWVYPSGSETGPTTERDRTVFVVS